jgi:hypothetical protein
MSLHVLGISVDVHIQRDPSDPMHWNKEHCIHRDHLKEMDISVKSTGRLDMIRQLYNSINVFTTGVKSVTMYFTDDCRYTNDTIQMSMIKTLELN